MRIEQRDFTKLFGVLAFAFILSALVSCSSKPEKAIVGKWTEISGATTIEYFKDGTITMVDRNGSAGGNYAFIEKDRIRVELGGLGSLAGRSVTTVFTVSISDDELTLAMPDGVATKFRREM